MLDTQQAERSPAWIEFRTGKHRAKMPFFIDACEGAWDKVLELTALGFRADRVGDAIVITGKPSHATGALS
jgi:hypothetical protein